MSTYNFTYWIPHNSYSSNQEHFTLGKDKKHLLNKSIFYIHSTFKALVGNSFVFVYMQNLVIVFYLKHVQTKEITVKPLNVQEHNLQ